MDKILRDTASKRDRVKKVGLLISSHADRILGVLRPNYRCKKNKQYKSFLNNTCFNLNELQWFHYFSAEYHTHARARAHGDFDNKLFRHKPTFMAGNTTTATPLTVCSCVTIKLNVFI